MKDDPEVAFSSKTHYPVSITYPSGEKVFIKSMSKLPEVYVKVWIE